VRRRTLQSAISNARNTLTNTWKDINWIREPSKLITEMNNPFGVVKQTREVWSKSLNQTVKEVQVQFANEEPAWIPLETLLAIQSERNDLKN
jgi:hypothetical protein